jgi:hypothetical protein
MFRFDVRDGWWVEDAGGRGRGVIEIRTGEPRGGRAARGGARRRLVEDWMLTDGDRAMAAPVPFGRGPVEPRARGPSDSS